MNINSIIFYEALKHNVYDIITGTVYINVIMEV